VYFDTAHSRQLEIEDDDIVAFRADHFDSLMAVQGVFGYDTAVAMLEKVNHEDDLTVDYFRSVLTAVHRESASVNTIYSNICDLRNGRVYLYYFHQFYQVVELNLAEELAQGERTIQIRDLFSSETVAAASAKYREYKKSAWRSSRKLMA